MRKRLLVLVLTGVLHASAAEKQLTILPSQIELHSAQARQQLLAEATVGDQQQDWSRRATWSSSNPEIVKVSESGLLEPVSDGSATIIAKADGIEARAAVAVRGTRTPSTWSFRNHVIPVLTKQSCNQGACHGALAGKNGFKLTLRGYDPELDHKALTREATARRVSLADPASSLVLLKSTLTTAHGGGQRLTPGTREYQVIAEWIASGAPGPNPDDPRVVGLEVYPAEATLSPEAEQQLVVRAKYEDGSMADVTRWAKYNSTDSAVASVDDMGLVKMTGYGEAAITVWYSNEVLYARLTVPFPNQVSEKDYEGFTAKSKIDELVLTKLKKLKLTPSRLTHDSEFIRRAYLDAAGILPTAEEVEEFLADESADKRATLIDRLLEREEFVDYWAYKWSDLMLVSSKVLTKTATWDFYNWIRDSVQRNTPWNEFAREIFTSSGSSRRNGALNYFVLHKDVIDLTENITQAFMGQRLTCARCHNHPLEKWTQTQYYEFANLFTRIGLKNGGDPSEMIVYAKAAGDINHPRLLRPLAPRPLDGDAMPLESATDRRLHFAAWLTSAENPYFARSVVSRVWANFFARGLVDPEDDLRATNPSSNEALFDYLAGDFVGHGFDVKHLIRAIMNSGAYQLSSEPNATNAKDEKYYSHYVVKRLPAEVILDATSQVTGIPTAFGGYPVGMRALQLPDVRIESQFLDSFGRPKRIVCDVGERSLEPSIAQALHVINGDTLNEKLRAPGSAPGLLLKLGLSDARILDHIFLSAFSRYPSESEKEKILTALASARVDQGPPEARQLARREALEDMMWALLTKKEFLFNY